ncbi:hypothetical protein [Kutzneria sp. NPDC052558]|uniref:hypothetical protein n=1 Tax=Kutzneria sp. NPDC052558 TaxID=3364121 RepID=UPI0037C53FC3
MRILKSIGVAVAALALAATVPATAHAATPWGSTTKWHNGKYPTTCLSHRYDPGFAVPMSPAIGTIEPVVTNTCGAAWDNYQSWTTTQIGDNRFLLSQGVNGCAAINLLDDIAMLDCSTTNPRLVWSVTGDATAGYKWKSEYNQLCIRGWGDYQRTDPESCDQQLPEMTWFPAS